MSVEGDKIPKRDTSPNVASSLAAMYLRDSIMAGNPAEIPSLGLTLIKGPDGEILLIDTPSSLLSSDPKVDVPPPLPILNRSFFASLRSFFKR